MRHRLILAAVCGVLLLTFLDTTIVSVALADVQSSLHASVTDLQWVVNAYALVFASLMLLAGTLGDRLGRRRVMLAGLAIFTAGSLLAAVAPNVDFLIAARGVMGLGAAASEPGTLSIIRHLYPESGPRARALGIWAAVSGLALALGPVAGGLLVGVGGWRAVFWCNLALALVVLGAAVVLVPESYDRQPDRLDVAGAALTVMALGTLVFAVIAGETRGYGTGPIVALFVVAGLAAAGLAVVEHRSRSPLLDLRYLAVPSFSCSLAVAFAVYFGIFAIFFFTALYLQVVLGYSGYRVALEFLPMASGMILAAFLSGRWVARSGPRTPMVMGVLAAGSGTLLTALALNGRVDPWWLGTTLTVTGLGFGSAIVPVTSEALGVVPPKHSGMAASAANTARELGAVVGVAVFGSLLNGELTGHLAARLAALGVPATFRSVVISAIETGGVPSGPGGAAAARSAYGPIVERVIGAAFGAFRDGLTISLIAAGIVMLAAGAAAAVAFWTQSRHPTRPEGFLGWGDS